MPGDFGVVYVIDWGLGTVMGTPGYMSPEQVRGDEVGPQREGRRRLEQQAWHLEHLIPKASG